MIELEQHPDGVSLPVQAQPKARKNALVGEHAGRLKVAVTQAPEKGKANDAILKLLAKSLGFKSSQLRLLAGETSPQKRLLVTGVPLEDLRRRIENRLAGRAGR
jgi:hypothetical protein